LVAGSPAAGLLPVEGLGVEIYEPDFAPLTSLAATGPGLEAALQSAHGLALPSAGRFTQSGDDLCVWFGVSHYLLVGTRADASLAASAAATDQSDAWCRVIAQGPRAAEMLAYLTPIDLRDAAFPVGSAARSLLGHMSAALVRREDDSFELYAFRSMAGTLVHELEEALRALP